MSEKVLELTDKVWRGATSGNYDDADIAALISVTLELNEKNEFNVAEINRLTKALGMAGEHIQRLDTLSNLMQYAEDTSF